MSRITVNVNGLSLVHEDSGGVSIATLPDVCFTPPSGAPVPYPNLARSRDLAAGSSVVRADGGHRIAVAGSAFARSTGGEPGSVGGVTSGGSGQEATFLTHSFDVTIEGRGACRLTDKMLHNRGNTIDCAGVLQDPVARPGGGAVESGKARSVGRKKLHDVDASAAKHALGLDTNNSTLTTAYALSRKRTFVGRYLIAFSEGAGAGTSNGANPGLTPDEVNRLHAGGMKVFAIWEVTKYRAIETGTVADQYKLGRADAAMAKKQIAWCGGKGRPIYFTVDFGVSSKRWFQPVLKWLPADAYPLVPAIVDLHDKTGKSARTGDLVKSYFEGIKSVLHPRRVGVYGTYTTVKKLLDLEYIQWGWQWAFDEYSPANDGKVDPRAKLHQTSTSAEQDPAKDGSLPWGVNGAGALDYDRAITADFGQW